jgi:RNA recognition motif-containing protein
MLGEFRSFCFVPFMALTTFSRIPHGFYEHQMREYFSQFGTISKLRLARNRRTGASKHFAFIEFESDEVAKIVANTMDNYLMFGHILKCKYAPQESLHPDLWKGANKRFKRVPYTMLEKKALEAPKTAKQWEKKNAKEQKKREQKAEKMKLLGYEMKLPKLKDPGEVLEQRKLLKATQESQDAPTSATEPPNGPPKDESAMQAEKKSKKKNKPDKQQPMEPLAQVTAAPQLSESAAEKSQSETGKRDKRKEKKAKVKDAKTEQLDAQLVSGPEASVEATKAPAKPVTLTTVEAESLPDQKDSDDTTAAKPLANGKEKKRKRRGVNEPRAAGAETTMPLATNASQARPLAEKPKQKKRKSEGNA